MRYTGFYSLRSRKTRPFSEEVFIQKTYGLIDILFYCFEYGREIGRIGAFAFNGPAEAPFREFRPPEQFIGFDVDHLTPDLNLYLSALGVGSHKEACCAKAR